MPLLNQAIDFIEKDLDSPEVTEIYEKLIKRRVSTVKEIYDDKKDSYILGLLRYFTEKFFVESEPARRKSIESILSMYSNYLEKTTFTHWQSEFNDYRARYKLIVKGAVNKGWSNEDLKVEAELARKLFMDYEKRKMDVKPG